MSLASPPATPSVEPAPAEPAQPPSKRQKSDTEVALPVSELVGLLGVPAVFTAQKQPMAQKYLMRLQAADAAVYNIFKANLHLHASGQMHTKAVVDKAIEILPRPLLLQLNTFLPAANRVGTTLIYKI